MRQIDIGAAFRVAWPAYTKNILMFAVIHAIVYVLNYTIILGPIMMAGYLFAAMRAVRGEQVEVGDAFSQFSGFGRYWLGALIAIGIFMLGAMACCIGVLPAGALLMFMFPMMIDYGMGAGDAFNRCWQYFKQQWGLSLVFFLILSAFGFVQGMVNNVFVTVFTGPVHTTDPMEAFSATFWPSLGVGFVVGILLGAFIWPFAYCLLIAAYDQVLGRNAPRPEQAAPAVYMAPE